MISIHNSQLFDVIILTALPPFDFLDADAMATPAFFGLLPDEATPETMAIEFLSLLSKIRGYTMLVLREANTKTPETQKPMSLC
jgi:hypothetical protein